MTTKTAAARGYGADHRELRARWQALFDQGHTTPCSCAHRGCPHHTGPCGTVIGKDTAWDLGHTDDRKDWTGPECVPCNRSAGARASHGRAGVVMTRRGWCEPRPSATSPTRRLRPTGRGRVIIVVGPPCAGKTTWVQRHREPADLVVDYDAIAVSLGSPTEHDHGREMIDRVEAARRAMLDEWLADSSEEDWAWVILTRARQFDIVPRPNIERIVSMPTELKECERRAIKARRDKNVVTTIRGYEPEYAAVEMAAAELGIDLELATRKLTHDPDELPSDNDNNNCLRQCELSIKSGPDRRC